MPLPLRAVKPNKAIELTMAAQRDLMPRIPSVRQQAANRTCGEKAMRDAAEHPLAEPAVPISTCHNQIGVHLLRDPYQFGVVRSSRISRRLHRDGNMVAHE